MTYVIDCKKYKTKLNKHTMTLEKKIHSIISNEENKNYRVYSFLIKKSETGVSVEKSGTQIFVVDDKSVYVRYIADRYCQVKKVLDILLNSYAFECYLSFERNVGYINKKKERFSFSPSAWKSFKRSDACMRKFQFRQNVKTETIEIVSKVIEAFETRKNFEIENYIVTATDSLTHLIVHNFDCRKKELASVLLSANSFEFEISSLDDKCVCLVLSELVSRFTQYNLEFKKNGACYAVHKRTKQKKIVSLGAVTEIDCLENNLLLVA